MNRGSDLRLAHRAVLVNGFNEAPIHESGKCCRFSIAFDPPCDASMRPRFMNRGSHPATRQGRPGYLASMRPRFMNRGSNRSSIRRIRVCRASMRPRFMNRGSVWTATPMAFRSELCFNEAPIHESGK